MTSVGKRLRGRRRDGGGVLKSLHSYKLRPKKATIFPMKLELSPFQKALRQLQMSLRYLKSTRAKKDAALRAQFRGATIQAFEYSYELAVRMIRRQLAETLPNSQEIAQMTFADLMRTAADAGLVRDVKRFLLYRDNRNRTTHTYEEKTAEEVIQVVPGFYRDAGYLLKQLRKRNP